MVDYFVKPPYEKGGLEWLLSTEADGQNIFIYANILPI